MEFTEPFDAAVVAVAQRAELAMPYRTSLPSMLPPDWRSVAWWSTPSQARVAPRCSATTQTAKRTTNTMVMAASTAQPWRVSPTMAPNV